MIEKHQLIVNKIRKEIVSGKYEPNDRLPTSRELATRFKASSVTVNRALGSLISDGYIRTSGRHGTFVTSHPPHLCQYGLICTNPDSVATPFVDAILAESRRFRRSNARRVVRYVGSSQRKQLETHERLIADIACQRLSGLIFVSSSEQFTDPAIWDRKLPCVALRQGRAESCMPVVSQSYDEFLDQAGQVFFESGHSKVAALFTPETFESCSDAFISSLSEMDMASKREWMQTVHPRNKCGMRNLMELLMADPKNRPNGLLIFDDVLTSSATQCLLDMGINLPKDLQVVSANSLGVKSDLPVEQLDLVPRTLLTQCFDIIDAWRLNGDPESVEMFAPTPAERPRSVPQGD